LALYWHWIGTEKRQKPNQFGFSSRAIAGIKAGIQKESTAPRQESRNEKARPVSKAGRFGGGESGESGLTLREKFGGHVLYDAAENFSPCRSLGFCVGLKFLE